MNQSVSSTSSPSGAAATSSSTHSCWVCSLSHWMIPSASLPPLYSMGATLLSFPQNLRVGKPWMSTPATSFSVESTFTSIMLGLLAILLAASSQWGANCLQCPHQGAQNSTKTSFSWLMTMSSQLLPTTTLTGSSLESGMGADLRKGEMAPLWICSQKFLMDSTETSSESNLYLDPLLLMKRILGVEDTSTPRYSASLSQSPCPSFLEETERIMPGLVASQSLKAWRAPASASSSPKNRKRASLLSLNTFSMASLLKGMTSDRAEARRRVKMIATFMDILKL